jgi:hypothetical protein
MPITILQISIGSNHSISNKGTTMTSTTIYTSIIPTCLYIKQHSITGLKYFGKTIRPDPLKYKGSGVYWLRHINKHGRKFVKTIWLSDPYYDTSIVEHALHFSAENNIVKSKEWANMEPENGLDGASFGSKHSLETVQKSKDTKKKNGTGFDNPVIIQKSKDTKKKNGTINPNTPETVQKCKDTKKERGIEPPMKNPELVQKSKDTKKERGYINPFTIPFLSIIDTRKTYAKCFISKAYPELKQYY